MPWYLPQHELPGKDLLSGPQLYARRERVFLVLASVFVAAAAAFVLVGLSRLYGVTSLVRRTGIAPPWPLLVPLGAFVLPLALLALNVVNALYGRRRAWSMVLAGMLVLGGVLGLHYATDNVVAYDGTKTMAFLPGLALAACAAIACAVQIEAFALLRRVHVLRGAVSSLLGIAAGWAVVTQIVPQAPESITGIALAAAGFTWLAVVAGTLVTAILVRSLALYLRFAIRERLAFDDEPAFVGRKRHAEIVED